MIGGVIERGREGCREAIWSMNKGVGLLMWRKAHVLAQGTRSSGVIIRVQTIPVYLLII